MPFVPTVLLDGQQHQRCIPAGVEVTISVGMAYHPPSPVAPELLQLIRRADQARRTAKADGRNCVRAG